MDKDNTENDVYTLLLGECSIHDVIIKEVYENLSVIPSNINLAAAEIELIEFEEKEFILKKALDQIKNQYDFILIDCPPSCLLYTSRCV